MIGEPKPRSVAIKNMTRTTVGSHPQYSAIPPQTPNSILFLDERVNLVRLMIHSGFVMIIIGTLYYSYAVIIQKFQKDVQLNSLKNYIKGDSINHVDGLKNRLAEMSY